MLAELMVAGRGIATAAGAFGSTVSNRHSSHGTHNGGQAAGAAFTGGGNGLVGVTKRAVGNTAASSATGTGSGLSSIIGGAMFGSSLASGGKFAATGHSAEPPVFVPTALCISGHYPIILSNYQFYKA